MKRFVSVGLAGVSVMALLFCNSHVVLGVWNVVHSKKISTITIIP